MILQFGSSLLFIQFCFLMICGRSLLKLGMLSEMKKNFMHAFLFVLKIPTVVTYNTNDENLRFHYYYLLPPVCRGKVYTKMNHYSR